MKNEEFFVGEAVHHPQRILLFLEAVLNFYKKFFLTWCIRLRTIISKQFLLK